MAPPSRMYVGVVVFGLIACLGILAYVALVLAGYEPPPDSPIERLFPEDEPTDIGELLFLALAGLFALAFTIFAWRRLLSGARRDAAKRRRIEELRRDIRAMKRQQRPPGAA